MKPRLALLGCLVCFATCALGAQPSPNAETPATREDILRMFKIMNIEVQTRQVMDQVMQQMRSASREQIKKRRPEVTEEELSGMDKESEEIAKSFPVNELLQDMIPVYQKHLNRTDVDAIIAFYSSPTGQKMLREMPVMTSEAMQAAYPRMQKNLDAIMKRMDEKASERQRKTVPAQPASPEKK
jgi:hypothetical protein